MVARDRTATGRSYSAPATILKAAARSRLKVLIVDDSAARVKSAASCNPSDSTISPKPGTAPRLSHSPSAERSIWS